MVQPTSIETTFRSLFYFIDKNIYGMLPYDMFARILCTNMFDKLVKQLLYWFNNTNKDRAESAQTKSGNNVDHKAPPKYITEYLEHLRCRCSSNTQNNPIHFPCPLLFAFIFPTFYVLHLVNVSKST